MNVKSTGFWVVSVVAAAAMGWFAAVQVQRGPGISSEEDAYQRFSHAFTITDSVDRIETVTRLVRRLTPETLPGAVRALRDDLIDVYNYDLTLIFWYWAEQDPRALLKAMQTWPEPRVQRIAAGEAVAGVLRKEGFDAAWSLFNEIPTHQRDVALPQLVLAALETGATPNLIDLIESYNSRDERDMVAGVVIGQLLFLNGPEALVKWVESLPPGVGSKNDLKAVAFRGALTELLRRDHFEFLVEWVDRVVDEPWAAGSRRAIAVNLAKREPLKAIEWAEALTPEQGREAILDETLRAFASYDRFGALQWLRAQPPGRRVDAGAARLAYELALREPTISVEMLGRIQDPGLFETTHKAVTTQWRDLPDDRRAKFLEMVENLPRSSAATQAP